MLRRQLQPLMHATRTLGVLAASEQPMQALPIVYQDEVGALFGSFNTLLETLSQRQQALQESEGRFRALADNAAALVWMADADGHCVYFNKLWFDFTGRSLAQEISDNGDGWLKGVHPDDLKRRQNAVAAAFAARQPFDIDYRLRRFDGVYCWLTDHGVPRYDDQKTFLGYIGTCIDITNRKQSEAKQMLLASVFTHALEGILITAADGSIIDTNQAFSRITGYCADEVRGKNPRILNSGRHPRGFYTHLWSSLIANGEWTGEVWNRRKDGSLCAAMQTISAVRDELGHTAHYVALISDITAIKEHEAQLEQMAHFDTLTQLPNRVLLNDRLHLAMAQAQRRQQPLALVFIDLDGFKAINDQHGHKAGDCLLTTVASRMKVAMRVGDTLARMGGDEFVAVLLDIANNRDCVPILQRLLQAAAQPVAFGDVALQVSASLGVAFFEPSDDLGPDPLLRQADQAMYEAKLAGKNRYHFYEPQKS
jgi:diguanylate cyclase (GGDEF)-like protein/PAS domain S-box-containing protein